MASPETDAFFKIATQVIPSHLLTGNVLEIGSIDVNGSIRGHFFSAETYIGVDICEGPGVDVVAFGNELMYPDGAFDVGLSSSALEHDPNFRETFANLVRMTRGGGAIVVSCAGRGFPEHGTTRTGLSLSPGTVSVGSDYYKNVTEEDLRSAVDFESEFSAWKFWYLRGSWDLLLLAYKRPMPGIPVSELPMPSDEQIRQLNDLMPVSHRIVRLPFRIMGLILPEAVQARISGIVWHRLTVIQERLFKGRFTRSVSSPS